MAQYNQEPRQYQYDRLQNTYKNQLTNGTLYNKNYGLTNSGSYRQGNTIERSQYHNYNSTYIEGNTLRYSQAMPQHTTPNPDSNNANKKRKRRSEQYKLRPQRKEKTGIIQGKFTTFLTITAMTVAAISIAFLALNATLTNQASQISSLQKQISNLKIENDVNYGLINQNLNLESVKKQAIKLGMTYVEKEQVITYISPNKDTIKQYENIPSSGVLPQSENVQY